MRDQRGLPWLDDLLRDIRYGLRALRRSPLFSAVAILSLALGFGVNTALFSVIDTVVLKKLPVKNPGELVLFQWTSKPHPPFVTSMTYDASSKDAAGLNTNQTFPYPMLAQFRDNGDALSDVFAFARLYPFSLVAGDQADIVTGQLVSGNYFTSLGVGAAAGRTIGELDDSPSATPVAVISHRFWENRFALDPTAIGKTVTINNKPFAIVGVTPAGFVGTLQVDDTPAVFLPMSAAPLVGQGYSLMQPNEWWMWIMGRLKPGRTPNEARDSLQGVFERTALDAANANESKQELTKADIPRLGIVSGSRGLSDHRHDLSSPLLALTIIVTTVLLIASSNIANLLIARANARQKEIAVRLAIGAGRSRLIRQLLTESVLLAGCGGTCGLFLAYCGKALLEHWGPWSGSEITPTLMLDFRVLAFTISVSLAVGLAFGLIPALTATRTDLQVTVKSRERTFAGGQGYIGKGLLTAQIALSMVLLTGAGLFIRTLNNLHHAVSGIDSLNVLEFSITPTQEASTTAANSVEAVLERIQAVPGVRSVTLSGSDSSGADPGTSGRNFSDLVGNHYSATFVAVRSNYFETMGIPMSSGRTFTAADNARAPRVLIVNEAFVRRFFDATYPLGTNLAGREVIGVVRDSKYTQLRKDVPPTIYTSYLQETPGKTKIWVRTAGNPVSLIPAVREVVRSVESHLAVSDVGTLADQIDQSMEAERILAVCSSLFGALAIILTSIGLYGITAYGVSRRTSEIGIRMAVGAQRGDVLRMVIKEAMWIVATGTAAGIAASLAAGRLAASILYGIAPHDAVSIILAVCVIASVAFLASYLPARRASHVDPTVALRCE
jgi:predicted permease